MTAAIYFFKICLLLAYIKTQYGLFALKLSRKLET